MTPTRRELLGALGGIGAVTIAGCAGGEDGGGGGGQETTTTTTTQMETTTTTEGETTTTTEQAGAGTKVAVSSHDELGDILVDGEGMTLYMFDNDTKGEGASTCYDSCLENWPPLSGEDPQAGDRVMAKLSTFKREDGEIQVAANGWPLYHFKSDSSPGDVKGQGVGDVWWVLDPAGKPIKGSGTTTTTTEDGGGDGDGDYDY